MKSFVWIALIVLVLVSVSWIARDLEPARVETPAARARTNDGPRVDELATAKALSTDTRPRTPEVAPTATGSAQRTPTWITLRLLDSGTHEPIPHLALTLESPTRTEALETDAEGVLHSAVFRTDEALTLDLSKNTDPADRVILQRSAAELISLEVLIPAADTPSGVLDVEVPVGPTYFLESLPGGLQASSFRARLTGADSYRALDRMHTTLRRNGRTWMRFSPKSLALKNGPPWKVSVGSDDGLWSGECEVQSIVGVQAQPLTIEFENTGCLRGRETDSDGRPAGETVSLWKSGVDAGGIGARPIFVASARPDADGQYAVRWVPAGRYTAKVDGKRTLFEADVELAAGVARELDIQLPPEPTAGVLSLRLTSETGTYGGSVRVIAHSLGRIRNVVSAPVRWTGDATDRLGRVDLERIEPCDQRIELVVDDGTPVRPAQLTVRADGRTLDIVVLDRTPMRDLWFEARDAVTDEPVEFQTLRASVAASTPDDPLPALVDRTTRRVRLPIASAYSVELHARGYCPLRTEITSGAVDRPIVLRMKKGFGTAVHAVDLSDHDLAGVRILLDARDCGTTDGKGVLNVELDSQPRKLIATLDGWHMTDKGDVDPDSGRFRSWLPWVRVVLEKTQR